MENDSFPLGFFAGFCGGIIGLLLVIFLAKDKEAMKKGAIYGFVSALVLNCVLVGVYMVLAIGMGASSSYGGY
jgi:hypothetical protein